VAAWVIAPAEALTEPAGRAAEAGATALEAATSRVALAEAGMLSAAVPVDSTEKARAPIAAAVLPAWDLEAVEALAAAVAVVVAGGDDRA
jgi:hypothetical protein